MENIQIEEVLAAKDREIDAYKAYAKNLERWYDRQCEEVDKLRDELLGEKDKSLKWLTVAGILTVIAEIEFFIIMVLQ